MVAYLLALLAALSNALSVVLQRLGVQDAPSETRMTLGLMTYALRRGVWLAGLVLIGLGFLLQALALRFGQLTSVQPIVTTELVFLIVILAVWFRYHLTWREWLGAGAAAGGLAAFLVIANPSSGGVSPGMHAWTAAFVAIGTLVAVAAGVASSMGPRWFRAAAYGTAAALMFALSAALTESLMQLVTHGWGHVFANWQPYALVACGLAGLFLAQNAYHSGPITSSQATLTIVDPLASVVLGIMLFHDRLQTSAWEIAAEVIALIVLFSGVLLLSMSPLIGGSEDATAADDRLARRPAAKAVGAD